LTCLDRQALAEAALRVGEAHRAANEVHVEAVLVQPLAAITADVARTTRIDRDARAGREMVHIRADLLNDSGDLVPERHGLADPYGAKAAMVVVM
jgi:hypothetical protein